MKVFTVTGDCAGKTRLARRRLDLDGFLTTAAAWEPATNARTSRTFRRVEQP